MPLELCTRRRDQYMLIGQQCSSCGSLEIILKTHRYRMCFRMCRISTALLPGRPAACLKPPDAIGAFQIGFPLVEAAGDFPYGLRWQTNPLYKGLSFCTSPNFLFCFERKNAVYYVIIPQNPCITHKQACLHTGEDVHCLTYKHPPGSSTCNELDS